MSATPRPKRQQPRRTHPCLMPPLLLVLLLVLLVLRPALPPPPQERRHLQQGLLLWVVCVSWVGVHSKEEEAEVEVAAA